MKQLTPKQIDLITNAAAGVTGMLALGMMIGKVDPTTAITVGFATSFVTSLLTGKGIPTPQQIAAELKQQSNPFGGSF